MDSPNDKAEVVEALEGTIVSDVPDAQGPVQVTGSSPASSGGTDFEVTASRLVSLDPDDPSVADIFVAVPVGGHVSVAEDGSAIAHLDDVDDDVAREVRAWARSLIASGSVAGMSATGPSFGPPRRPTHELVEDNNGRRILRRTGFALF